MRSTKKHWTKIGYSATTKYPALLGISLSSGCWTWNASWKTMHAQERVSPMLIK